MTLAHWQRMNRPKMQPFFRFPLKLTRFTLPLFLLLSPPLASSQVLLEESHYVMGTWLRIAIPELNAQSGRKILRQAFEETQRLDGLLSHYRPDTPLSRLNHQAGRGPQEVPSELMEVLRLSVRLSRLTEGAFDITIGPLVSLLEEASRNGLWSQDPGNVLPNIGWELLRFPGGNRVELSRSGMRLDLGGIGKGYAVDQILQIFLKVGVRSALVNFGESSLLALGSPPDSPSWNVLVRGLQPDSFLGVLALRDKAVSTSTTFGMTFQVDGKAYGHIFDPRTGLPLVEPALAVVVADEASQAEALSKALLVLGPKVGFPILDRVPGTAGLYASEETLRMTPAFEEVFAPSPSAKQNR